MQNLLRSLHYEYDSGGLKHLLVGGTEYLFISALQASPRLYWRIAPQYFRYRCSNDIEAYDYPPDPFKIELVDPSKIERTTSRDGQTYRNRRLQFGAVQDGNWDRECDRFDESPLHRAAKAHFLDGVPWEETDAIAQRLEEVERGESIRYKHPEELLERYRRFTDLYHQIKEEGYRSQRELLSENGGYSDGLYLDTLNEVTVDVGRDGELLYVDGFHRLSIAKLLDLDEIPIVFLVRHEKWMEYRESACGTDSIPNHPDLRDLKRQNDEK